MKPIALKVKLMIDKALERGQMKPLAQVMAQALSRKIQNSLAKDIDGIFLQQTDTH